MLLPAIPVLAVLALGPEAPPPTPATVSVQKAVTPRLLLHRPDPQDDRCDIAVEAEGLPAIARDGSLVAIFIEETYAGADESGPIAVEWRRPDGTRARILELADQATLLGHNLSIPAERCAEAAQTAERAIARINAILARYRALAELPVETISSPGSGQREVEMPVDPHQRPVEVVYRNGRFVGRVRGVKLLQSDPYPTWRGDPPDMTLDRTDPAITALHYDPQTRIAVAALSYESMSCMSDPSIHPELVSLAPALVSEAHARAHLLHRDDSWESTD